MTNAPELGVAVGALSEAERASRWLEWAFRLQTVLLILVILMMGFVSWRFNAKQRQWADENLQYQKSLEVQGNALKNAQDAFITAEFNSAFEARNEKKSDVAERHIDNALRYAPADSTLLRLKALILIDEKRAQQAMEEMQKAPVDNRDGRNLITEAILQCALGQRAMAHQFISRAEVSYRETSFDVADIQSVCHGAP